MQAQPADPDKLVGGLPEQATVGWLPDSGASTFAHPRTS